MTTGDSVSAPRSLQKEILDRTWDELSAKGFDEELIAKLRSLAVEGRVSHSTQVIAAIEESVQHENP